MGMAPFGDLPLWQAMWKEQRVLRRVYRATWTGVRRPEIRAWRRQECHQHRGCRALSASRGLCIQSRWAPLLLFSTQRHCSTWRGRAWPSPWISFLSPPEGLTQLTWTFLLAEPVFLQVRYPLPHG